MPRGERVPWSIFISGKNVPGLFQALTFVFLWSFSLLSGLLSLVGGLQCWLLYMAPTGLMTRE